MGISFQDPSTDVLPIGFYQEMWAAFLSKVQRVEYQNSTEDKPMKYRRTSEYSDPDFGDRV
jgi:hypothetical protein